MSRFRRSLARGFALAGALLACGIFGACGSSRLPAPPYVGQPTEAMEKADYPPPPARVELIPASPRDDAVWIDGEWTWQVRRWAWKRGRWVTPPPNATYSPWTSVRDSEGTFYVAEGTWRDRGGRELPEPPPLAVGRVAGGAVVTPEGEAVPRTRNIRPRAPQEAGDASTDDGGA